MANPPKLLILTAFSALALSSWIAVPGNAHIATRSPVELESTSSSPDEGEIVSDLPHIAKMWGLPEAEARRQLQLQDRIDTVPFASIDHGFAEVRGTPGEKFVVNYYSTQAPTPELEAAFAGIGLAEYVSHNIVPFTYEELSAAQADFRSQHSDLEADTWLDIPNGEIVAAVTSLPGDSRSATVNRVPIRWKVVESLMSPLLGGGRAMTPVCTAGFVVAEIGTNNRRISTAGHCDNNLSYQGYNLTFNAGWQHWQGSGDFQTHDNGNVTWNPNFFDGASNRSVQSRKFRSGMNIDDPVCKHGKITGFGCGRVFAKDVCPSTVSSCNSTFVWVRGGYDLGSPGDSGGPVFLNNEAWGLISSQPSFAPDDVVFMPQQFFSEKNVEVVTN
jgi:hypothetical protein